jgi:hypothetical protein
MQTTGSALRGCGLSARILRECERGPTLAPGRLRKPRTIRFQVVRPRSCIGKVGRSPIGEALLRLARSSSDRERPTGLLAFLDLVAGSLQAPEGVGVSLARESERLDPARVVTHANRPQQNWPRRRRALPHSLGAVVRRTHAGCARASSRTAQRTVTAALAPESAVSLSDVRVAAGVRARSPPGLGLGTLVRSVGIQLTASGQPSRVALAWRINSSCRQITARRSR